jgi:ribosomal protein L24
MKTGDKVKIIKGLYAGIDGTITDIKRVVTVDGYYLVVIEIHERITGRKYMSKQGNVRLIES